TTAPHIDGDRCDTSRCIPCGRGGERLHSRRAARALPYISQRFRTLITPRIRERAVGISCPLTIARNLNEITRRQIIRIISRRITMSSARPIVLCHLPRQKYEPRFVRNIRYVPPVERLPQQQVVRRSPYINSERMIYRCIAVTLLAQRC